MTTNNPNDARDFEAIRRMAIEAGPIECPDLAIRWFTGKVGRNVKTGLAAAELASPGDGLRFWLLANGRLVEE